MTLATAIAFALAVPNFADPPVAFERGDARLHIKVGGSDFAAYVWDDPTVRRPYFTDLRSPTGVAITRNNPPVEGKDPTDHATMHPGLWLAFGDISDVDFWRNKGLVRHVAFLEPPTADSDGGGFVARNAYESAGKTICEEVCRIRITVAPQGVLIDWTSEFRGPETFVFGDQEEMGLGVRLATDLTVSNGGKILDSAGRINEKQVWGRQADWCDYAGERGGIMLMPDPGDFRRSWFHARDYGLLVANPFGRRAFNQGEPSRVVVERGNTLTLRFGVLVHDAALDRRIAYRDFLRSRKGKPPSRSAR